MPLPPSGGSFEVSFFQATMAQDFLGQVHKIQGPKPFDVRAGADIVDNHPP
jgi:hypothetical protein